MRRSRWLGTMARVTAAGAAGVVISVVAFGGSALAARGVLDTSYGTGGFAFTSSPGTYSGARAAAIDGQGRVVAAGFAHVDGTIAQDVMVPRFLANAALDSSFGTGGVVVTDVPDGFDEASAVAIAPDGKVVVAGRSGDDALVARYDMSGRLDASFGGGVRLLDTGGEEVALAVAVTANGKVVVGGRSYAPTSGVCCTMDGLVARYRTDGTLDPAFGGGDGLVTVDLVPGTPEDGSDRFQAIQLVADDGIVAADTNGGDIALARLEPNGALDASFGR